MPRSSIQVAPIDAKDWVVKEEGGREYGHYPTQQEAEDVARKLARKHKVEMIVQDRSGKIHRSKVSKGWFARLFGR
jgi:Uncharacterized protein conserved in bacteria (DUF2188)